MDYREQLEDLVDYITKDIVGWIQLTAPRVFVNWFIKSRTIYTCHRHSAVLHSWYSNQTTDDLSYGVGSKISKCRLSWACHLLIQTIDNNVYLGSVHTELSDSDTEKWFLSDSDAP